MSGSSQGSDVLDASMDDQLEQLMAKLDAGLDDIEDVVEQDADAEFAAIVDRAMNGCDAPDRDLVGQLETDEAVARRAVHRQWDAPTKPFSVESSELRGRCDVEVSATVELMPVTLLYQELAARCRIHREEFAGRVEPTAAVCVLDEAGQRAALDAELQHSIEGLIEIRDAPSAIAGEALRYSRRFLNQRSSIESALLSSALAELDVIAEAVRSVLTIVLLEASIRGRLRAEAAEFMCRRDVHEERRVAFGYTTRYALGERESIARTALVAEAAEEHDGCWRVHQQGSHEVSVAIREHTLARERHRVENQQSDDRTAIEVAEATTRFGHVEPLGLQISLVAREAAARVDHVAVLATELFHFSEDWSRSLVSVEEGHARAGLSTAFTIHCKASQLQADEREARIAAVSRAEETQRAEMVESFRSADPSSRAADPESEASNVPSPNSVTHIPPTEDKSATQKSAGDVEAPPRRISATESSTTQDSATAEACEPAAAASPPAALTTMPPRNLSPVHEASPVEALSPAHHESSADGVSSSTVSSASTSTPEGFSSSTSSAGGEGTGRHPLPQASASALDRRKSGASTASATSTVEDIVEAPRATARDANRTAAAAVIARLLDRAVNIDAVRKAEDAARDRVAADERTAFDIHREAEGSERLCAAAASAMPPVEEANTCAAADNQVTSPPPAVEEDRGDGAKRRDVIPHESAAQIMGGPPSDPDTFTQPPSQASRPAQAAAMHDAAEDDPVSEASDGAAVTENTLVAPLPPRSPGLGSVASGKGGRPPAPPRERPDTAFTMSFEKECDKLLAQLKGLEKMRAKLGSSDGGTAKDRKAEQLGNYSKSSNSMLTSRSHSLMNRLIQKQPGLNPAGGKSPHSHHTASDQPSEAAAAGAIGDGHDNGGGGDDDDAVHPDDPQARTKVAALAKEKEAQRARKKQWLGGSERHPAFVFLDISFVLLSFLSCIGALFQVHPRAEELEDSILSAEALAAYNAFVTIFTIAWVVSRFFLAKRKGDWEVIDDLPTIRSMYVRTWFGYDLLFTIPIDFIFVGWQWEVYGWMQLRHFLRLVRIFNLGSSHNPLLSSRLWFRFMSFCCFMVLTMHTLGCIFWALESTWSYEESLYWAVATVTSVGYGDVVPRTTGGRVYVCFAMFFGIAMLSTMTAFATSFLTDKDKLEQEEESKKQMMYAMLEYYDVPWSVQKEVIAAVPALLDADNESEFKKMTAKLPPFVAHKIESYINVKMLRTVPIFADIDDMEALMDLSNRLTQQFYPAGEAITEQGACDRAMHFIIRGVVELVVLLDPDDEDGDGNFEAVVLGTLAPGSFFGEETLFEQRERPETAQTISVVEVLTLTHESFAAFTETHPSTASVISDSLRRQQLHRAVDEGARGDSGSKMNPLVGASAFSAV